MSIVSPDLMLTYLGEGEMTKTLVAVFDGEVLRPEEPLDLQPNTRVRITLETAERQQSEVRSFLRTARSLKLEGPRDWSTRIEEYLYGRESDVGK